MKFDALRDRIVAEVETRMDIKLWKGYGMPSRWNRLTWPRHSPTEPPEPESSEDQGDPARDVDTQDQSPGVGFRRVPNQNGVEDGQVRLYCDACKTNFTTPADQQPKTRLEGHRSDAGQEATKA